MALRPEPPMSMARVMGPAGLPRLCLADLGAAGFADLGVIRTNCTALKQEIENRKQGIEKQPG
jgi:hypothetical protein